MSNNRPRPPTQSQKGKASTATAPPKKSASSQRFAERQAAKEQAAREARRARTRTYGIVTIALVVVIVAVLVVVKVAGGGGGSGSTVDVPSPPAGTPIPATTLAKLQSVPVSTLTAAPTSGILTTPSPSATRRSLRTASPSCCTSALSTVRTAPPSGGRYTSPSPSSARSPRQPGQIHSANLEGDVPTLTFYGTTYTSPYFTFTPVEVYTNKPGGNGYTRLQTPTQAQLALWQSTNGGAFPFVDFGGKVALASAQYSYGPLQNLPFEAVAAQVGNNSTVIGSDIDASAAQLISTICGSLTHDQPSNVCSAVHSG